MIPKGLFTQIGMVIVAVAIIVTYVQPAFSELGGVQDEIGVYQDERKKVADVNEQLDKLVTRLESISNEDEKKLNTYLPDEIDEIHIKRDLLLIANQAGVLLRSSSFSKGTNRNTSSVPDKTKNLPTQHTFSLSVEGTFGQLKNLFSLMEQNHYPMEVSSVSVTGKEGNFLDAEITFATYTYQPEDTNKEVIF